MKWAIMLEVSEPKFSNMVAERRLTAMMLLEAAVLTGREYLPSSMLTQEKVVVNAPKELMVGDPVLPYWESSGEPKGGGV